MIPHEFDDGFTFECEGVLYRPMMQAHRKALDPAAGARVIDRLPYLLRGVFSRDVACKILTYPNENKDFQDLNDAVQLHLLNPGMSELSCGTCKAVAVDHRTGEIYRNAGGQTVPTIRAIPLPCESRMGCVKGHHSSPIGLSNPRWAATWRHFWYYRSIPDHPLVKCPMWQRNRLLLDWIAIYGRDRRFDPFVGGGSCRGAAADKTEGAA